MAFRRALVPFVLAVLIALVYWPGLHGFWGRDDFMQLAFARLVGSPWPLFFHDHYFPVPGSIFRPLGFASFWLWQALFGTDYFANAFGDMLLHIAVSFALFRVIRASGLESIAGLVCTLVFALHPGGLGTALWWSARFDLLAALFALDALRAALDYAQAPRTGTLIVALACVLAALLSKETALAAVVAIALTWLRRTRAGSAHRRDAIRALIALAAVVALFFVWRWLVLGTAGSGLAGGTPLVSAVGRGFVDWFSHLAGYLSFWPRLGFGSRASVVLAALIFITCIAVAVRGRGADPKHSREIDLLYCGLCLFVLPALLQAPVAALNAAPLGADMSVVEAAMQSRLYYLSFGGFAILLSLLVRRVLLASEALGWPIIVMLVVTVAMFGATARRTAVDYAARTAASRPLAEAAATAVDALALPPDHCHVVVLGVDPPAEWSIYVSMDAVVKALTKNPRDVDRCFIHSGQVTYFNLMGRDVTRADAWPYGSRESGGAPLPWLEVGDALVAYLDPPPQQLGPDRLRRMRFVRFEQGTFRDVTDDVVAGRIPIKLR